MVPIRPKWVPSETTRKLQDCSTRQFKVVKQVIPNAYVIDVSSYRGLAVILDDLFYEPSHDLIVNLIPNPASIKLPSKCKEHIDTILDEQIIFTRDRRDQRYSRYQFVGRDDQTSIALGSPERSHNNKTLNSWSDTRTNKEQHFTELSFSHFEVAGTYTGCRPLITWLKNGDLLLVRPN